MKCACGTIMCYTCRKQLSKKNPYTHFCQTPHCTLTRGDGRKAMGADDVQVPDDHEILAPVGGLDIQRSDRSFNLSSTRNNILLSRLLPLSSMMNDDLLC